jgi:hypothetical protein
MWALLVEAVDEGVEAGLLLQYVGHDGLGGFELQREVQVPCGGCAPAAGRTNLAGGGGPPVSNLSYGWQATLRSELRRRVPTVARRAKAFPSSHVGTNLGTNSLPVSIPQNAACIARRIQKE